MASDECVVVLSKCVQSLIKTLEPGEALKEFPIETGGVLMRYVRSNAPYSSRTPTARRRFRDFTVAAFVSLFESDEEPPSLLPTYVLTYTNDANIKLIHLFTSLIVLSEHIVEFLSVNGEPDLYRPPSAGSPYLRRESHGVSKDGVP